MGLDVSVWQVDNALWNARYCNPMPSWPPARLGHDLLRIWYPQRCGERAPDV